MKKSLVKLAALSSAAFVLAGTVAPNVLAYTEDEYQDAWEKEMDKILKEGEKTQTPLEKAKKEAKEELAKMGVTGQLYFDQIDKAKTIQGVQNLVQEIKKAREKSDLDSYLNGDQAEEDGEADYLDEAELGYAKELAKKELKEMGVTGQLYFDQIDKAKTIQGVQNLVQEIKKARENQTEDPKPETPETSEEPKPETPETPEKDLDTVKKEALARLDQLQALTQAERENFTKAILDADSADKVAAVVKAAEDVNFSVNLEAETPAKEVKPEESKEGSKKEEKKEDKKEKLPETGEVSSFAIFGGAALSVLAGLGLVASKKEEN